MGIFTNSINKNLISGNNSLKKYIEKASLDNSISQPAIKDVERYSLKSLGLTTPSPTSYSGKRIKLKSKSPHKFTFSNEAKSADIPFKATTQSLSKTKITSPASHISAEEIEHISKMVERDARRYLRRF